MVRPNFSLQPVQMRPVSIVFPWNFPRLRFSQCSRPFGGFGQSMQVAITS